MEKIIRYRDKIEKVGLAGVFIYGISLVAAKGGVNIGLALMTLSALFFIKDLKLNKIEKEYKFLLIILFLTPIFDIFSPGGVKSSKESISQMYRLLPLFIAPIFLTSKERIEKFLYLITGSVLVNCVYGLNVYRLAKWNFKLRYQSITNIMDSAHALVGLSFIVLTLIVLEIKNKKYKRLAYLLPVYFLNLTCILLGQTRGAWLALIGGLGIFALLGLTRKMLFTVIVGITLLIGFNVKNLQNNRYIKRLQSISNAKKDDSSKIRLLMWEASTDIYLKHPVFGVGKDNSSSYYLEYFEKNNSYNKVAKWSVPMMKSVATAGNPHNMYFENLVDMGALFFGLLAFWGYILYIALKATIKSEKNSDVYWLYLMSTSMIIAYYITGLTEASWGNFIKRHVYLVAIIVYISNKRLSNAQK
ncbi:O-antigen ligase family protein [uncultured Cetobacterium sp.]|uniref:O-antigen ligase family protein n=1 Tax=uncultured Cetobacterium sp. TaxID=527638 RepID=UPI0025ED329F|nr:O-antigen ligase family protein [uncultured Cetobacterium sp.]